MSTEIANNYIEEYTTQEKLQILADAAKYDVACTSSGSDRRGRKENSAMRQLAASVTALLRMAGVSPCLRS